MAVIEDYINRPRQKPQAQEVGIGGFTALVRVRDSYRLTAEAPATPVENGSFVNDHIIRKPITLSIEGSVTDVHLRAAPVVRQFQQLQAEVGNVASQYAPARTTAQISLVNALANDVADALRAADNVIGTGVQAAEYFGNQDPGSKGWQEAFLDTIEAYHFAGSVLSIDMPYRRHDNMVITSFQKNTDNTTDETTFTIEAQQLEFAELQFVSVQAPAAGLNGQIDEIANKGTQEGEEVESSLVFEIFN